MFPSGRLPKLTRDRDAALDFVPIGQRVISPEKQHERSSRNSRMPLTAEKIDNTHIESSFDETTNHFDTLDAADIGAAAGSSRSENAGWSSRGKLANTLDRINQVTSNGQSSIQELQADSQQIKQENYNLKVEVATLKQFLKQTPAGTQELVQQNSVLRSELLKTQDELKDARESSRISTDKSQQNFELETLKRMYKDAVAEKDHELNRLQRQVNELSQPRVSPIPQDLLDKVEFLQNENQSLLRQLEGYSAASDKSKSHSESENNELKLELHRLKAQMSKLPSDASEQLEHLRKANETLQQKLRTANDDLEQVEEERDSLVTSLRNVHLLVGEKQSEIENLSRFRDEAASSKNRTMRDTDSRLERAQHEIDDLQLKLKRTEAALTSAMEDKLSDIQRLQRKLDTIQRELKEKDREEFALKAQIQSLMQERNKAFDNQVTIKHYQAQIDNLRVKEKTQFAENLRLKDDLAKLQDEMYSQNVDSSRSAKLRQENADLVDRLEFYEKEYALTQEAMEAVEGELDLVKNEQKRHDNDMHSLQTELESMRTKLRRTELSESRKYNESAYMELEEKHRQREDAEHRRMGQQIDALNTQIHELERQLEVAKQSKEPSADTYQPVLDHRLRNDLHNKDFELQERQREITKLQNVLKDKEDLVDALEDRIRKLNKEFRTDFAAEDRYRENLQKLKLDHESEISSVRLERERLQSEVKIYKSRLESMEDNDTETASSANSITIALLTTQLDELRRKNHALLAELETASTTRQSRSSRETDEHCAKISELRSALQDAQQEKCDLELTRDTLESDLSLLRSEKGRSESRNRALSQELTKNARSCTRLANKVQDLEMQLSSMLKNSDDVYRTQKTNIQLQNQVDQLSARLASVNIQSQSQQPSGVARTRLQENELRYCKAKLFELQTRYMDLASMNAFMISSIKTSSETCKDDLVKIASSGIYPDYSMLKSRNKKLTFKALALFVLGTVRMKKRTDKAKARESKLAHLRGEIERDRITLLVEKP